MSELYLGRNLRSSSTMLRRTALLLLFTCTPCLKLPTWTRRSAAALGPAALLGYRSAHASEDAVVARGIVRLSAGAAAAVADAALYVTVRPIQEPNAPAAGPPGATGKFAPPLAAARFAGPLTFPYEFELSTKDLTEEFASVDPALYMARDLTVSARFDTDGVASTRGPDDLVGRTTLRKDGSAAAASWPAVVVELQGRGLTGRLFTGGGK